MRNAEYLELPMEDTLKLPAVVCTDGLHLKPSKDVFVGNMALQHSHRLVNGFQERGHL